MTPPYHIRYLKRQEIDPAKWDACIDKAPNGLVYAYSFYLDNMARQWDALVWNDYEAVMPLTWNKNWGIKYLYQPPLTQQLGIFCGMEPESQKEFPSQNEPQGQKEAQNQKERYRQLVRAFLDEAARHFRFAEIFLNYKNEIAEIGAMTGMDAALEPRMNYILQLDAPYSQLRDQYSTSLLKNLAATDRIPPSASAVSHGFPLHYTAVFDPAQAIAIYHTTYRERLSHVKKKDYDRFLKACLVLQKEGGLLLRAVYGDLDDSQNHSQDHSQDRLQDQSRYQLLAVSLLLKKKNRIHLMLPSTLPEGKKKQANHFLLDQLIREFAGQDLILDFEGSDIPGIARFYKKFGPVEQPYFFFRFNRLPWPLRLLKK